MSELLCRIFGFLKYVLLVGAFILVFMGILKTYGRLEKPLTDAIPVFIPFALLFISFCVGLLSRNQKVKNDLLFNFCSFFSLAVIIIFSLRAMFDKNMILFERYEINFNPAYFSDNLSFALAMLYLLFVANVILLICGFIDKKKKIEEK